MKIYDLNQTELNELVTELGQPAYRAKQLWQWLYQKTALDYESMTNLPLPFRTALQERIPIVQPEIAARMKSSDRKTVKVLFKLDDGRFIETVLMKYKTRRTLCISTQAGCAMGCVFCATGQMGFMRHLTLAEIVYQVVYFAHELAQKDESVTNVVMMGMGEPLHNYDNTLAAVDCFTDADGLNLGARKITISTVGLIPAIRRYAAEKRQTPLAISLHAATDEERDKLIPINKKWPIADLMDACHDYIEQTGRRLTFEWALIGFENDTPEQAHQLGKLLRGMLCHVNLIPLNPTNGYTGRPSDRDRVDAFQEVLEQYRVTSTVRVRRGIDIQAGCGQLRDRIVNELSIDDKSITID